MSVRRIGSRRIGSRRIGTVLVLALVATVMTTGAPGVAAQETPPPEDDSPSLCVGLRGNGPRVFAHFGALSRIAESTGPIDCAAGGSSGSITAFLVESTLANPLLEECGDRACTAVETAQRQALLFRSMGGLSDVGVFGEIRELFRIVDEINRAGVEDLLQSIVLAQLGVFLLLSILDQAGDLINPGLGEAIRTSANPAATALDIVTGLGAAATFQPVDAASFIRPGPLDFAALGELVGRAGSFYAGYAPADLDAVGVWLDECAAATVGLTFAQSRSVVVAPSEQSCGDRFLSLYGDFRAAALAAPGAPNRLDDTIGTYAPVLASTGVLQGAAVTSWDAGRAEYRQGRAPDAFRPDFADVGFGVFGSAEDLAAVDAGIGVFDDFGAEKTVTLFPAQWREILAASPAEPGLSAGVPLSDGSVSVGGWADPLRVQILSTLGPESLIAINRIDGLGAFTVSIGAALGATPAELQELYGLSVPDSNLQLQLAEANGVVCSDWDTPPQLDVPALFLAGYDAPLLTDDPELLATVPTASATLQLDGCTPGLTVPAPDATFTATPTVGLTAAFDAAASTPGFGSILQYRWDFGDGTSVTTAAPTVEHQYATPGTYEATVSVTNSNGSFTTSAPVAVTVDAQRIDLRFSGLGYRVLDAPLDGRISTELTESRNRITGGGTFPGRSGGVATVEVDLTRNQLFDRWSGTITVDDPGAGFSQVTQVNVAPLRRNASGIRLTANWVRPGAFLPTFYTLNLAVR